MNKQRWMAILGTAMVVVLAACGSGGSDSAASDEAAFNDADVMFAQMMIPHHEQREVASDIALDPTVGAGEKVRELATEIKGCWTQKLLR